MARALIAFGALALAFAAWSGVEPDEHTLWALLLPGLYLAGMFILKD